MSTPLLTENETRESAKKLAKKTEERIKNLREVVIDHKTTIYTRDFKSSADQIRKKYYDKYENPNRLRDESR
jgi:hypothetical protein